MATKKGYEGTYWITELERLLLHRLLRSVSGDYLEIGAFDGVVATEIARAFPKKMVHCVDLFHAGHSTEAGNRSVFEANVAKHRAYNVRIFEGDSRSVVPTLLQTYGVILVDGDHAYASVLTDLRNSWAKLSAQGMLVFHDYGQVDDVTRAVDDFIAENSLDIALRADSMGCVAGPQCDLRKLKRIQRWAYARSPLGFRTRLRRAIGRPLRCLCLRRRP